jgi:nitroreductase
MPLMDCLRERRSTRKYSTKDMPLQELSNVLWAAFGLSREDAGTGIKVLGSHTAPTAHNSQAVDVYVATAAGLYLYEPHAHELQGVLAEDIRACTDHPAQRWVAEVPVILIYVADLGKMKSASDWDKEVFPYADSSFMSENVYLYCASAGLATVVRALMDREVLAKAMGLGSDQVVTLSQPVGYPG